MSKYLVTLKCSPRQLLEFEDTLIDSTDKKVRSVGHTFDNPTVRVTVEHTSATEAQLLVRNILAQKGHEVSPDLFVVVKLS